MGAVSGVTEYATNLTGPIVTCCVGCKCNVRLIFQCPLFEARFFDIFGYDCALS